MSDIKVKEVSNPVEGEFTLSQTGELVQYKNGKWVLVDGG